MKAWMSSLAVLFLLTGCAGSLRPLAEDQQTIFDPALVGAWVEADDQNHKEIWTVRRSGEKTYSLEVFDTEKDSTTVYELRLLRLSSFLFFESWFDRVKVPKGKLDRGDLGVVPVHFFGRISIEGDTVRLGMLNEDWLSKALDGRTAQAEHMRDKDFILLTGTSAQLREFALKYAEDPKAFPMETVFRRRK